MEQQPQVHTEIKKYIELFTDQLLPVLANATAAESFDINKTSFIEENDDVCAIQFNQVTTHRVTVNGINFVKDELTELTGKLFPDARIYSLAQLKDEFGENSEDYIRWKNCKKKPEDVVVQTRTGKLWHFFENDIVIEKDGTGKWVQTYPALKNQQS